HVPPLSLHDALPIFGSLRPYGGIVPYAAAKAGVNTMTVGLAEAFGPTVRVNCVIPGSFRTDVVQHWDEATMRGAAERPNLKRIGDRKSTRLNSSHVK